MGREDKVPGIVMADREWRPGHPGTVFFDTAAPGASGMSMVACEPLELLRGPVGDGQWLDDYLELQGRRYPAGILAGAVDFSGQCRLGFYDCPAELPPGVLPSEGGGEFHLTLKPSISEGEYIAMVMRAKEFIAAGDIYQACVTYPFCGEFSGDPWGAFLGLRAVSPAPYAAYCNLGEVCLLSASPELFLQMDGREVKTCPIKGTRPRRSAGAADLAAMDELRGSEKERAELVMITDLERNDLGRVCEFGSIRVEGLLRVESHPRIHHLVSTVAGRLKTGVGHAGALAACFPGGSISGAPKVRALQILGELERSARGFYTGAIGWFGCDGRSRWNIAIRTLELSGGTATYGTGAGIVADSDPRAEWQETLLKACAVSQDLPHRSSRR